MPHHELNDRFKAHIARAQGVRRVAVGSLLTVSLLVGSGLAFEMVYADHGFFNTLSASSTLTVGQELCVKDDAGVPVCVTGAQLRSLLNGSVLGASAAAAAGPTADDGQLLAAPGGSSAAVQDADTATSTTPSETVPITSASSTEALAEPVPEPTIDPHTVEQVPTPEPAAANDNGIVEPLPATGIE
jgi:hypothetical protein